MSCALFVAVLGGVVGAAVPPPHIIALTVDDWGYYDVGEYILQLTLSGTPQFGNVACWAQAFVATPRR